jgi:hypothetical protein
MSRQSGHLSASRCIIGTPNFEQIKQHATSSDGTSAMLADSNFYHSANWVFRAAVETDTSCEASLIPVMYTSVSIFMKSRWAAVAAKDLIS